MTKNKRSFFERLTGSVPAEEEYINHHENKPVSEDKHEFLNEEDAELTIDMYQTPEDIVIQTMVAGVKPEDLDVSITQDMITVRGKRTKVHEASNDNFYYKELFWGSFSRSILLPQEVDSEEAEATIKHGILTIKIPKLDKTRVQKVKIKSE